jgi:microcystin-dependent protein
VDPFVAEIRIFPFNFSPTGWASCDGQLLPLSQNTALFSLLGTTYGGDGKSTFALPNLQGAAAMHPGQGPGLSQRFLGQEGGEQFVTLLQSEMPIHQHTLESLNFASSTATPNTTTVLAKSVNGNAYQPSGGALVQMGFQALPPAGGGLPHNNLMPYLTLRYCIALQGVFPPRT